MKIFKDIAQKIKEFWLKIKNHWAAANNWQRAALLLLLASVLFIKIIIKILIVKICWYCLVNFVKQDFLTRLSIIKNALWVIGGILGFWFASKRLQIADKNQKTAQTKELHERYARAVELLSNDDDAVRMGALYSLKQIAEENEGEFFEQCKEIIAGYVRNQLASEKWKQSKAKWLEAKEKVEIYSVDNTKRRVLFEDIKTGINILSYLTKSKFFTEKYINLQEIDLSGIDFKKSGAEFNCLDFSGSNFTECWFKPNTNLSSCRFESVNFKDAVFLKINFRNADFGCANFNNSVVLGCDFSGADLMNSNFYMIGSPHKIIFENTLLDGLFCRKEFFEKLIDNNNYIFINLMEFDDKYSLLHLYMKKWFGADYNMNDFSHCGVVKLKKHKSE